MDEDNWFAKAAREAEASERGVEAARRAMSAARRREIDERAARKRADALERMLPSPRPAEAAAAATMFEAVASGKASPLGTGPTITWGGKAVGGYYHHPGGTVGSVRPPQVSVDYGQSRFPHPTPEQGLEAILEAIREAGEGHLTGQENADAVLKAGGEWITKVTNAITQIIRESEDES